MMMTVEHPGPIVAAFGGGTNSAAMLIEFARCGQRVDLITFSDTKGEKPHTYRFVKTMSDWCVENGLPPITILRTISPKHGYEGLEGATLRNLTLPSKAFGMKSCSQRFKIEPQTKFLNSWQPAKDAWHCGQKVLQVVGYDAGELHRATIYENEKSKFWYPLIQWGWGRDECIASIESVGLPRPGKSACFFCPSSRKHEVLELATTYPLLFKRAVDMESQALASGKCTTVKGLGRHFSWKELVEADEQQRAAIAETTIDIECACFDGDEEV